MGIFSALLVDALTGAAKAGVQQYANGQAPRAQAPKKKRKCSSCDALRDVERAKNRVAKGKL